MRSRLLVVDDNPGYLLLVRLALEDDPHFEVVAGAASADEALAAAAAEQPDAALVDVLLPHGEGFRLPALLADLVPGCVVVLTSAHPEVDLAAIGQLGGTPFLPKSVAPKVLGEALAAVIASVGEADDVRSCATVELPSSSESPRLARRFVEATLAAWGRTELADTVTLLVSELVANAVLHTSSEVELSVRLVGARLRVDVVDRSTSLPRRRDAGRGDPTGRGSDMVEMMATAWGISGRPDGKSIWFEIALPAAVPS